jgi:sensor c-di-GMP phosphodiesterase-like protein
MTALGSEHHVVMIDPASFIDIISPGQENIHAILFGIEDKQVITSSEPLDPVVWEQIKHLDGQTLTVDNTVYRLHRILNWGWLSPPGHPRCRCRKNSAISWCCGFPSACLSVC